MTDINAIISERENTHGDFAKNASLIYGFKTISRGPDACWHKLSAVQATALDMIFHKVGRLLSGNPNVKDHWDDIAGYAKLVSDTIPEAKPKKLEDAIL